MEERKRKTDWDFFGPIRRRPIWFRTTTLLFVWPTREIGKFGPDCYHYHPLLLLLLILLLLSQMKKKKDFSSKRLRESKFVVSARLVSYLSSEKRTDLEIETNLFIAVLKMSKFTSFSRYNFNNSNYKKHRRWAWNSNLRPLDGRRRWNHGAMAATHLFIVFRHGALW